MSHPATRLISVAIPAPLFGEFDYIVPESLSVPPPGARVKVPFGPRQLIGIVLGSVQQSATPPKKLKSILAVCDETSVLTPNLLSLMRWAARYYCHPLGECCQQALPTLLRKHAAPPVLELLRWRATSKPFEGRRNAHKQRALLELLGEHPEGLWQQSLSDAGYPPALLRTLEQRGYLVCEPVDVLGARSTAIPPLNPQRKTLSTAQQSALAQLQALPSGFAVALLQGITGSGKTEVYIEYLVAILAQGRQALILIPEINLTPQTFTRFQKALPYPIATLHSGMSDKAKYETWEMARKGIVKVVIGTRSAVFSAFQDLGCIVVDEEHDSSFKQSDHFKYSGRDLAIKRAQIEQCPIILGSATPSLETLANAQAGRYHWLTLNQRAGAAQLPLIQLIDIRSRPLIDGLSQPLLERIKHTLNEGNQVIVFQNRRGFAPTLMCYECGWVAPCHHCDVRMTLHAHPAHLHCHHCDARQTIPQCCPQCQSRALNPIGSGTERIEIGLRAQFPDITLHRIDRDRFKRAEDMQGLIDSVATGQPCILIGTQMLAKGHDFHHVTLVCVADADSSLFSADYRALERGAQLLTQIAGRTGRGQKRGQVLIQTRQPEHPLFSAIQAHNYSAMMQELLHEREHCQLPPFSKQISIRAESRDANRAEACLQNIKQGLALKQMSAHALSIAGPIPAQITRKQNFFRYWLHLFLLDPALRSALNPLLQGVLSQHKDRHVRLSLDVDPLDYL